MARSECEGRSGAAVRNVFTQWVGDDALGQRGPLSAILRAGSGKEARHLDQLGDRNNRNLVAAPRNRRPGTEP